MKARAGRISIMRRVFSGLAILALASSAAFGAPRDTVRLSKEGVPLAAPEVTVDRVAYSYEQQAISKLK